VNSVDYTNLKIEISQPIVITSTGKQAFVPFKEYDYTQKFNLSISNEFLLIRVIDYVLR
jgi:hypothetical protein